MKTSLFAIAITALLLALLILPVIHTAKADDVVVIDTILAWYGPPEDINHDGDVNYLDASSVVSHYGGTDIPEGPGTVRWDINRDGSCDYLDASRLVTKYELHWLVP
jgi:hypothetical protein